ncbi:MAG: citramalate synthase [Verrucomicrobiales bacterium]
MSTTPPVALYDTTLRDGTQGLGVSFSAADKLRIAQRLDDFGMDYIEGGYPFSNEKDLEFFRLAAGRKWKHAKIAAFGRSLAVGSRAEDDPQLQALLDTQAPVVTVFGKSWDLHVTEVLRTTLEENVRLIRDSAAFFKKAGREYVYDAEHFFDGYKANPDYCLATLAAAVEGGADILVLCDTNGGTLPGEVAELTRIVREKFGVPVGIHPHDDSGLGVANALAAVQAGAVQVQGTMNGYGERTGNANLTTIVPCLQLKLGIPVVPDLTKLSGLSHFVDEMANTVPNPRAPFVGITAFAHKGGGHVNAVQKLARSYEHIEPASVGNRQVIVVSEVAGGSNIQMKAEALGYSFPKGDPRIRQILERVKAMESEGFEFEAADASFELLIRRELGTFTPFFELLEYHCSYRRDGRHGWENCIATVKLVIDGEPQLTVSEGDGPVNALDGALRKALSDTYPQLADMTLVDYKVRIIDSQAGTGAKTRVLIESSDEKGVWGTVGVSSNIIDASWQALVDSLAYFLSRR